MLLGPAIYGKLAGSLDWPIAFASLAVTSALGLMAGALTKMR